MYYIISGILNLLTSFSIGALVFINNRHNPVNRSFVLFTASVSIWSLGYIIWQSSGSYEQSLFWIRFAMIGSIAISPAFTDFIIHFVDASKKYRIFRLLNWIVGLTIILFSYSKWFIKTVEPIYVFKFWPVPGFLFFIFHLFFVVNSLFCWWLVWDKLKLSSGISKVKESYVLVASCIGFIGGMTNHLLWYKILIPPFGNIGVAVGIVITAYAITRYQLMDIEVLIKKSLVFAGTFIFAFGVFVGVTLTISQLIGGGRILSLAISSLIIVAGLRPIENWLVNATDKFLFQKKYGYKPMLQAFIDREAVLSLDEIVNSTLNILSQTLHPSTAAIVILNRVEDTYQLYNSIGLENKNIVFTSESKLVNFFKKHHAPAAIKQTAGISEVNPDIQKELSSLKAIICLPLLLRDDLIGFISFGSKKSDEDYTKDDLDVLLSLAKTESINISYAFAVTEVAQSERRAAIGTMSAGINHEIGNPLNIINTKIQVFLAGAGRGLYTGKTKEEVIQECVSILNETINQTNRIAEITRKLSNFAKPSKEFKPELLAIPQEIDGALDIISNVMDLGRIKIKKEISSDPNTILADKREIEQVLSNLIRNAGQAIEGSGTITIRVLTTSEAKIRIEIEDTGKGIPEDKMHRIFEPFFTTKGPIKGTGLGLSIVRQLVWKNKGEISFKSEEGKGTIFILEFPKAG